MDTARQTTDNQMIIEQYLQHKGKNRVQSCPLVSIRVQMSTMSTTNSGFSGRDKTFFLMPSATYQQVYRAAYHSQASKIIYHVPVQLRPAKREDLFKDGDAQLGKVFWIYYSWSDKWIENRLIREDRWQVLGQFARSSLLYVLNDAYL